MHSTESYNTVSKLCTHAQLYWTLWDPMYCSLPGSSSLGILRQEYWSGLLFPSPGDLPDPGMEPGSPAWQADIFAIWATIFSPELNSVENESEVAQLCPTLCDPLDDSPPGSSVRGTFPGKSTGVDCHFLLQNNVEVWLYFTQPRGGSNVQITPRTAPSLRHLAWFGRRAWPLFPREHLRF